MSIDSCEELIRKRSHSVDGININIPIDNSANSNVSDSEKSKVKEINEDINGKLVMKINKLFTTCFF